ncbi:MAG: hypothetical protein O7D29_00070, partial [Gemmatimonadetes bacterium]|nr:hypothetical protein [Gemmatimonadota bacterium]
MDEKTIIKQEVAKLTKNHILGRSRSYARLLEFLAGCSIDGRRPKELEIAAEVFGKGSDFDPNQDSLVRVYVHNLRQKLDKYYAREDQRSGDRLAIPRGEYRLAVISAGDTGTVAATGSRAPPVWMAILIAALAINLVALVILGRGGELPEGIYDQVSRSSIWASFMDDELPFLIVVGDYYIFGEIDEFGRVERLVRDFDVNSADDLADRF